MPSSDYFAHKARAVLRTAGGDPADAGPLAQWAQAAWTRGHPVEATRRGVIVGQDGTLHAETGYTRGDVTTPGATYGTRPLTEAGHAAVQGGLGLEVGLALGRVAHTAGHPVIHVTYSQVCSGPEAASMEELADAQEALDAALTHARQAQETRDRLVRRLVERGGRGTAAEVARVLGISATAVAKIARGGRS